MREDYVCQLPSLPHDEEGFGDLGFGDSEPLEMIRDGSNIDHSLEPVKTYLIPLDISLANICTNVIAGKFLW